MKEHGILFSAPMVRALLAGTKTQTRRLVKPPKGAVVLRPMHAANVDSVDPTLGGKVWVKSAKDADARVMDPKHGPVGRRLWVRETWGYRGGTWCNQTPNVQDVHVDYRADGTRATIRRAYGDEIGIPKQAFLCGHTGSDDDRVEHIECLRKWWAQWRPAIHMPRWASRITLEVTRVRLERVQSITEEDARAEGATSWLETRGAFADDQTLTTGERMIDQPYRSGFAVLWDTINGDVATWKSNPWVWAYDFRRVP